ncbi:DUF6144 family protein [Vallitalea okinawensis]|uniref:DUF6144 family protein n=1 Tax=Vallitalea okinawensis TaxID=2078660 RepID=UPI000CFD53E7|nr:DUF6144 family protein [Vallitalea okinawensis]
MEHLQHWINNLMNSLESETEKELSNKIIENCGRVCAKECGATNEVKKIITSLNDHNDIDIILERMNLAGIGGGKLHRIDNHIYGIYETCYCPSRNLINNTSFCNCTKGWLKEVFEDILGKTIDVKLEQTIAQGDSMCKFQISY